MPDGPGGFTQDYSCPALLRMTLWGTSLRVRGCHPLRPGFPDGSARNALSNVAVLQHREGTKGTIPVWAGPRSLAATGGIIVIFFSSGY